LQALNYVVSPLAPDSGVCWNKKNKRWQAAINSSGKYIYLGSYVQVRVSQILASRRCSARRKPDMQAEAVYFPF